MENKKVVLCVINERNEYIDKCCVRLKNREEIYKGFTNKKGIVKFCIPICIYELSLEKIGYKSKCYRINVNKCYDFEIVRLFKENYENVIINLVDNKMNPIVNGEINITNNKDKYTGYTDKCGIAMLSIYHGYYKLNIIVKGYENISWIVLFDEVESFTRIVVKKKSIPDGTVLGKINVEDTMDLKDVVVILYSVDENNKEKPIKYTYTNEKGEYSFDNIDSGKYLVKETK